MLDKLLPPPTNFPYTGSRISLWLLGLVLVLKVGIALGAIFNGHYAASVADGIPIDSYTAPGTQAFLALFAALGLSQFALGALGMVLLAKYRALVPLFLFVLLAEQLARKGVDVYFPIQRAGGAAGGFVSWAIIGVMFSAFVLSLKQRQTYDPHRRLR